MKLEEQVISLELAKKLKELGVKQESHFYWVEMYEEPAQLFDLSWALDPRRLANEQYRNVSAFTVAELGEMLPFGYYSRRGTRGFTCGTLNNENYGTRRGVTEADARAKMLIYLLENKLIKTND